MRKFVDAWERQELEKIKVAPKEDNVKKDRMAMLKKVGINVQYDDTLDDLVNAIHERSEKFDPKAERAYNGMQVFTAAFASFSHGANDVANAIAPFAAIYGLYSSGGTFSTVLVTSNSGDTLTLYDGNNTQIQAASGDPIPDGKSFCGILNEVKYYQCNKTGRVIAPGTLGVIGEPRSFPIWSLNSSSMKYNYSKTVDCYHQCQPGTAAALTQPKTAYPNGSFYSEEQESSLDLLCGVTKLSFQLERR
mmetsp:Transcript_4096/g.7874  ORF Transcript_4096/g.7874 Transcript_4096/m.7874 type:complete len:248 (-) Transcript_4096:133-876(-)